MGKTFLSQSLADAEYFDCELPRIRVMLEDVEGFLRPLLGRTIILDEIHRLQNPSELLKIAADHYPEVRILATGSYTPELATRWMAFLPGRECHPLDYTTLPGRTVNPSPIDSLGKLLDTPYCLY